MKSQHHSGINKYTEGHSDVCQQKKKTKFLIKEKPFYFV